MAYSEKLSFFSGGNLLNPHHARLHLWNDKTGENRRQHKARAVYILFKVKSAAI